MMNSTFKFVFIQTLSGQPRVVGSFVELEIRKDLG